MAAVHAVNGRFVPDGFPARYTPAVTLTALLEPLPLSFSLEKAVSASIMLPLKSNLPR